MTNHGSFHGSNVPAHAPENLDVSGLGHSKKRRPRVDFYIGSRTIRTFKSRGQSWRG